MTSGQASNDVKQRQMFVSVGLEDAGVHAQTRRARQVRLVNRPGFGTHALLRLLGTGPISLTFEREVD
jgi:hypothetical protein